MTRAATPKLAAYLAVSGLALVAALALGRAELVIVAAGFLGVAVCGLALARAPRLRVSLTLERDRVLEGREVDALVEIASASPLERLEVLLGAPVALRASPVAVRLRAGETRVLRVTLSPRRWGAHLVGPVALRARDPFGLVAYEARLGETRPLKVHPSPDELAALIAPAETQVFSGNRVSRRSGEGVELAEVRPLLPGDRLQRVNWRVTARRGTLHVTERHQERNADVVLLLDTFAEARRGETGTLDRAVRAASALAAAYLAERDRVGVVGFGGIVRWLPPGTGLAHGYRIAEALLDAAVIASYAWKDVDAIPPRVLSPKALVIALTPLLDERVARALLDLRGRGFDVAVLEVSPLPYAGDGRGRVEEVARRLWALRREALRARYRRLGVPVAEWREGAPLGAAIAEVTRFRRRPR